MRTNAKARLLAGAAVIGLSALAAPAGAQPEGDDIIVVTGTRVEGKSPTETLSPIDVLPGDSLADQGSFDLTDTLTNIAPSINTQRFPIADGTSFIRPVNLRNLAPDQTLVLVNGARRHRSALVNLQVEPFGTVNQGAQAVDFGLIPSIAIKRLEVLRDGASAQYGSDAIAGVINIILRDNAEGLDLTAQYGQYYEGDGENFRLAGNLGLPLGEVGFFNFSAEYVNSDITSRGSARPDAAAVAAVVGPENVPFDGLGQRWGDPDIEGFRLFFNSAIDLGDNKEIYAHGSYADQETVSGFFYRAPFGIPGVSPRATLCACDASGDPLPTPQSIVDDIIAQGLDPNDFLTADAGSPSGFVSLNPIHTLFPGGYNPTFGADIQDYAGVFGVRGEKDWGLQWDISGRFAENQIQYVLINSINPGLGINSPLEFRPGDLAQRELGVNADFVYPWVVDGLASPVNIAFGAEYRREVYEIKPGDPDSFAFGPTGILFGVGSDGFQGDSPDAAGIFRRPSYAGYVDVETDLTEWLTFGAAGRIENFPDFDETTFDWKVSARVQPMAWFALRGTVNTGFRAPTPGQINTLDVTTTSDAMGNLVPLGTFPVNSVVAQVLGAEPLTPEESFNITAGVVFTPTDNISVTVDYYNIDVDDRIALITQTITPGSPEDMALIAAGFPGLGQASFFQNGFDTTVEGVDVTAVATFDVGVGTVTLDARHSYNKQTVDRVLAGSIDAERVFDLENQLPNHRSVLTLSYDTGERLSGFVRANRYGEWQDFTFGEIGEFGSEWLVDLEVKFRLTDQFAFAAGAENVFDNFPDDETNSVLTFLGATRPVSSPFGFNGGFWYVRAEASF
ncbi:MAG: TonB-dependent receptor [Amphiplicatus sp.]